MNGAARELQTRLYAVVGLVAIWLLSSVSLRQDLEHRRLAEDLVAWTSLKDAFQDLVTEHQLLGQEEISEMRVQKIDGRHKKPIEVVAIWPSYKKTGLQLHLASKDEEDDEPWWLYDIRAHDSRLRYASYRVLFEVLKSNPGESGPPADKDGPQTIRILRKEGSSVEELTDQIFMLRKGRRSLDRPHGWEQIYLLLVAEGAGDFRWSNATSTDQAIARVLAKANGQQRSLLGMPFDSGLFFCAPGVILLLLGLSMIGPIEGLRHGLQHKKQDVNEVYWTIATVHSGSGAIAWEAAVFATSIVMACLPLALLSVQLQFLVAGYTTEVESWLVWAGALGVLVCVGIQLIAAFEIDRLREAKRLFTSP